MSTKPIATALVGKDHVMVLADIIADRLNVVHNLSGVNRMYLIGSVDASALYWLAQQFDVLGYRGWFLAETEEQRRELIRRAIELHRYKGTPWAVKEAIKSLGFTDVTLQERVGLNDGYYNGVFNYDASHTYGDSGIGEWATFKVFIGLDDWSETISPEMLTALIALINEYKNVRSHLVGLYFTLSDSDELELDDVSDYGNVISDVDYLDGMTLYFDGTAVYNGEYDYDLTADSLQIVESPVGPVGDSMKLTADTTIGGEGRIAFAVFTALGGQDFAVDWGDGFGDVEYTSDGSGQLFVSFTPVTDGGFAVFLRDPNSVITGIDLGGTFFTGDMGGETWCDTIRTLSNYLPTLVAISIEGRGNVEQINGDQLPASLTTIIANDTPLSSTLEVNNVLTQLDTNGALNGTANFTNSGNPDGDGITAIANLIGKGWDVTWDI